MNRLVSILTSCDLEDITSLRRLYKDGCEYSYYGIDILCSETHKTTPECVKFTLRIPLTLLNVTKHNPKYDTILADFSLREFVRQTDEISLTQYSVTGKVKYTGAIYIYHPGPRVLLRNVPYTVSCSYEGKTLCCFRQSIKQNCKKRFGACNPEFYESI